MELIIKDPPLSFTIPDDFHYVIYHSMDLNGRAGFVPNEKIKKKLVKFIQEHNRTSTGNTTELPVESLERLFLTPCIIVILFKEEKIIGTIISLYFRAKYYKKEINTSYTTFLCVHKDYRKRGLALLLIEAVLKEGYYRYHTFHGCYLTSTPHCKNYNKVKSWYRPINIKRCLECGFILKDFSTNDHNTLIRKRVWYHISKPKSLPKRVTEEDYDLVIDILEKRTLDDFYLIPTKQELDWLCKCFDIYTVGKEGLFFLFPLQSKIESTGRRINHVQLALMIGDLLNHVLWVCKDTDLLYGWYNGDITVERVEKVKGITTISECYLELYNTKNPIEGRNIFIPIF